METINVVWCDDAIDVLNTEENRELFALHNCRIFKTAKNSYQLKEILEEHKNFIDAVIVDFNMSDKDLIPSNTSASGFRWVHEHLSDYSPIPFFLYSARDIEFIDAKYQDFEYSKENDYFFSPNSRLSTKRNRYYQAADLNELLNNIEEEVSALKTPEFKVRNEFSEAFAILYRFNLDSSIFIKILLSDENIDRYDVCNIANPLRKVLEEMVSKFISEGIIPCSSDLNKIPGLLHGKDKDSIAFSSQDYMHKSLFQAFEFIIAYTQDGSHNKDFLKYEFHEYLKTTRDIYIIKAIAIIALDVIKWMGEFYDKYIDIKPFHFVPFKAKVIKIIEVNGEEGAIVKDADDKTYFVTQPKNPKYKYSKGSNIEIINRKPTKREYGDYYAFGKNLDVID